MTTTIGSKRDQWVSNWSRPEFRHVSVGEGLVACMLVLLKPKIGSTFVDFGCGTGRAARRLNHLAYPCVGVDFAPNCLDGDVRMEPSLDEVAQPGKVPLLVADITSLPRVTYADYGYCCDTLTHDMPYTALEGIARTTRKGAFLSIDCRTSAMAAVYRRAVSRYWKVSTCSKMGSIALYACRDPVDRITGADPWR